MKVYVVMYEDCYTYGEWDTEVKVFADKERARQCMENLFKDYLEAEDITEKDLVVEDEETEAEENDYVLERYADEIKVYQMGYYVENHILITIQECEVE